MLLDTHIWIWWVNGDPQLRPEHLNAISSAQQTGIEISIISCWEVAKLVENQRLVLSLPVRDWLNLALSFPGIRLLPLTLDILIESTQLPGTFHKDPADQIVVATARVHQLPLLTFDSKILAYPDVTLVRM